MKKITIMFVSLMILFCVGQAKAQSDPFMLFVPVGYNYTRLEEQTLHIPTAGIGFMLGKMGIPFTEVERLFLGIAQYQSFVFTETLQDDLPKQFHGVSAMLDGKM